LFLTQVLNGCRQWQLQEGNALPTVVQWD